MVIRNETRAFEQNGSIPVTLQDQTTPPVIVYANKVTNTTTLSAAAAVNDKVITVVSAAGILVDDYLGLFNLATNRYYVGTVISISVNDLTLDTPLDSDFEIGDTVGTGINDLNVDGSITPQVFVFRGADPGIDVTVDVTRIIIQITTNTGVDFSKFGDIDGGLLNGVVMRRVDGFVQNIFNIKTNADIANLTFDYRELDPLNPSGVNGIISRLTFAGQNKMGVVLRIGPGEMLEFIVQDDLTSLLSFRIVIEGSVAIV